MSGLSPHDLLMQRSGDNSTRGDRRDKFHLALVLEGGGMRGVVSIAMALAFEELGLLGIFDSLHGASAGACACAYFASGQSEAGASIYYEDINNRQFIDFKHILRGHSIMNKDFLIDLVMRTKKPLNTDAFISTRQFLHVVTTDAESGEEVIFSEFEDREFFFQVLKASICMPLIAGHSVIVNGRKLVDGGMVQQIALRSAISAGATHVIVLMTHKDEELNRPDPDVAHFLETTALRLVYGPNLANLYRARNTEINRTIEIIKSGATNANGRQVRIDSIARPNTGVDVGRLTTDENVLKTAFMEGRMSASKYISGKP